MCAHRLRPLYNVNRACSLHLCVTAAWRPFSHRRCSDCCIDWWDKVVCSRDPVGTDSRVGQRGEDGLCIDGPRNSAKRLVARLQLSVGRVRVGTQAVALHRSKGWVVAEVRIASECSEPQRARSCMLVHSASAGSRTRSPADSIAAPLLPAPVPAPASARAFLCLPMLSYSLGLFKRPQKQPLLRAVQVQWRARLVESSGGIKCGSHKEGRSHKKERQGRAN